MIGGRHREVTFLVAGTVAKIVLHAAGIPASLFCVDEVEAVLLTLIEADIVEDEELSFGAEVGGVCNAGRAQVHFGLAGNVARVAIVALLGDRVNNVAHHHQRGHLREGVEHVRIRVRHEQHIALVNGRPAANGRAVHTKALFE